MYLNYAYKKPQIFNLKKLKIFLFEYLNISIRKGSTIKNINTRLDSASQLTSRIQFVLKYKINKYGTIWTFIWLDLKMGHNIQHINT